MRRIIDIICEASTDAGDRAGLNLPAKVNLPAKTPNTSLTNGSENHFDPQWYRSADLPPALRMGMEMMGPHIFNAFTSTPIPQIDIMAEILNGAGEVQHMMEWITHEGERLDTATMDLRIASADYMLYRVRDHDFLLVRDPGGHYIYSWPSRDSRVSLPGRGPALPAPQPRLP